MSPQKSFWKLTYLQKYPDKFDIVFSAPRSESWADGPLF